MCQARGGRGWVVTVWAWCARESRFDPNDPRWQFSAIAEWRKTTHMLPRPSFSLHISDFIQVEHWGTAWICSWCSMCTGGGRTGWPCRPCTRSCPSTPGALLASLLSVEVGVVQERHVSLKTIYCAYGGWALGGQINLSTRTLDCLSKEKLKDELRGGSMSQNKMSPL